MYAVDVRWSSLLARVDAAVERIDAACRDYEDEHRFQREGPIDPADVRRLSGIMRDGDIVVPICTPSRMGSYKQFDRRFHSSDRLRAEWYGVANDFTPELEKGSYQLGSLSGNKLPRV